MDDSAESRAEQHERLAQLMEDTEGRMHMTADVLKEPAKSAMHERADRVTDRAERHMVKARKLRARG